MSDLEVLIFGAGPVGLTLGIDLGQRGIKCALIERKDGSAFLPKMERVNARTWKSAGAWDWPNQSAPPASRGTRRWTSRITR